MNKQKGILSFRLNQADQFKTLFKTACRLEDNGLFLLWVPSSDEHIRVSTIVRKKLYKKAVDRNRVRRVCRELIYAYQTQIKKSWVIFELKQRTKIDDSSLHLRGLELLRKSGLLEGNENEIS